MTEFFPARDRLRARSLHHRPARRQARRRHRAAQSLAPPALAAGAAREVLPKNILMIGPTGVGKTEIARRLAQAGPGAVPQGRGDQVHRGRLCRPRRRADRPRPGGDRASRMIRETPRARGARPRPRPAAEERMLDALVGSDASADTRETFRKTLRAGELDDKEVEIEVRRRGVAPAGFEIPGMPGASMGMINLGDMLGKAFGGRTKPRKTHRRRRQTPLIAEESDKLLDQERVDPGGLDLGRAERHRLHRRDRQDLRPQRAARRRRCQPRGRAARSAAADRGHDGLDQARAGEDRPHPVHRLGRLPSGQALAIR